LSIPEKEHQIYPYLLRDVTIDRPDVAWATDITYIRLKHGFIYLVAVIDLYSRYIVSWKLSTTLETDFCCEALEQALKSGRPEYFNTDQGPQFTSREFTSILKERKIRISMDGKGRVIDNIFIERFWRMLKYEEVVCYERNRCERERKRCFTRDEGRPLEVGLQEWASNRLKLRRLRAVVVSVEGKGGAGLRQVRIKETNVSEPLMTCRNILNRRQNRDPDFCPAIRLGEDLLTAQSASGMKAA